MSLLSIDPFAWIDAWRKTTKLFEWVTLLTSLWFSGTTSFLFTCGTALMAGQSKAFAIGSGMVSAAVMSTVVWRRSPLTKGTTIALPEKEAEVEIPTGTQVITK